jgi:hypothetical protein
MERERNPELPIFPRTVTEGEFEFQTTEDGEYLRFTEINNNLIGGAGADINARFAGEWAQQPNFGKDLKVVGDHALAKWLGIHKDDYQKFVQRMKAFYTVQDERVWFIRDGAWTFRDATLTEIRQSRKFLADLGYEIVSRFD